MLLKDAPSITTYVFRSNIIPIAMTKVREKRTNLSSNGATYREFVLGFHVLDLGSVVLSPTLNLSFEGLAP